MIMCSVTTVYKKLPFTSNTRELKGLRWRVICLFIFVKAISKLTVEQNLTFETKFQKLSVVVHILQTTQNLVISHCCLQRTAEKCTKNYNARALPLYCSISVLFSNISIAVAVVVFKFLTIRKETSPKTSP